MREGESKEHYIEGNDSEESHLPSKSHNPEKQGHGIPSSPSAQTAKNVGMTVRCHECGKPRLLYARNKRGN